MVPCKLGYLMPAKENPEVVARELARHILEDKSSLGLQANQNDTVLRELKLKLRKASVKS
jgi:hypothetical protein